MTRTLLAAACTSLLLLACRSNSSAPPNAPVSATSTASSDALPFTATPVHQFNEPWAMTFLPDGRLLVTEKPGALKLFDPAANRVGEISGVPAVDYGGQGGLGDIVLHPAFASNNTVYLSYAEAGEGQTRGAAVARARPDPGR